MCLSLIPKCSLVGIEIGRGYNITRTVLNFLKHVKKRNGFSSISVVSVVDRLNRKLIQIYEKRSLDQTCMCDRGLIDCFSI